MTSNQDNELDFVLRHYREGAFNPDEALRKMNQRTSRRRPRWRWVAAAASLLCIVAFAGIAVWQTTTHHGDASSAETATTGTATVEQSVGVFHFDDTPLPQVLDELGHYYGVSLQASDTTRHLTGSFSGEQLDDILAMIEEVLQVKISRNEK